MTNPDTDEQKAMIEEIWDNNRMRNVAETKRMSVLMRIGSPGTSSEHFEAMQGEAVAWALEAVHYHALADKAQRRLFQIDDEAREEKLRSVHSYNEELTQRLFALVALLEDKYR